MTSNLADLDELDEKRENLFTVFEEKNSVLGRNTIFQRIVILSKIKKTNENLTNIGLQYEKFLRDTAQNLQTDAPTGFLMIHRRHVVHIIEAPIKIITLYMREVHVDNTKPDANFEFSKVLILCNDVIVQHYPFFQWQVLEIEGVDSDNFQPVDKDEKIVIDLLKQLLDIGMYITKTPKHYVKQAFETLFTKNSEFIPSQGVINYLLNEDIDCISTVEEMLNQLDTPYDTLMPSDYVWPLPNNGQPYSYLFQ